MDVEGSYKCSWLVNFLMALDPLLLLLLGLLEFYYLVQDLKSLIFSLMALHFKIKPI